MTKSIDLSKFTSIGIGPVADVFIIEDENYPDTHTIIGHGNNLLIGANHPPLMMLSKNYDYIMIKDGFLVIGAATPSGKIVSFCKKHNIANFEFMLKLPGVLGGMVKMNAGLKEYEIFNHLVSIQTREGEVFKKTIPFSYRHTEINDVIFEAKFEIIKGFSEEKVQLFMKMRDNQPQVASAGSCFINPKGDFAGRLIQEVGLKGLMKGAMCFSVEHANFLANTKSGTFEDAVYLINEAKLRVKKEFGIDLQEEIVILN